MLQTLPLAPDRVGGPPYAPDGMGGPLHAPRWCEEGLLILQMVRGRPPDAPNAEGGEQKKASVEGC